MILDVLDNHFLYHPLHARLAPAFAWFGGFHTAMPEGRYEIAGDDVFALVQSYEPVPATQKAYESHRRYPDIQYLAMGAEVAHHAPVGNLLPDTAYDTERDFQLFRDPASSTALRLTAGRFALFFPHDAHKPGCAGELPGPVKKVVIKVRV